MGCSQSSSKREVYSNTILTSRNKQKKSHQIDNLTLHLKLEKEQQQQQKPKLVERKKSIRSKQK